MTNNIVQQSSIDKSIGYLVAGIAIAGFIMLTIAGMATVQRNAEGVTTSRGQTVERQAEQPEVEFDFAE